MRVCSRFVSAVLPLFAACGGTDPGGDGSASGTSGTDASATEGSASLTNASTGTEPTGSDATLETTVDPDGSSTDAPTTANDDASTTATDDSGGSSDDDGGTTGVGGEPNVLYVHGDGENGNPGTIDAPMRTIQWAISQAVIAGDVDTIRVAEGEYTFDYANDQHIVVADGVSLYGGYRSDWGARDPAAHVTRIVDATEDDISPSEGNPHRAIEIPAGVGADTVIDGFHVGVTSGNFRAAILAVGDATIRGNVIAPLFDDDAVVSTGVRVEGDATIVDNRIRFEVTTLSGSARAILASGSNGVFANNVIDLSNLQGTVAAVYLVGGAPTIVANSVFLNGSGNVNGLYLTADTAPIVDNNLIESTDIAATCMWSSSSTSVPATLRNNVLNCSYVLFGIDPLRQVTTVMVIEGSIAESEGNLKLTDNVVTARDDMALDASHPCIVTQGGRDVSADVPEDVGGNPRTAPLSIGAHEWDGGCQ